MNPYDGHQLDDVIADDVRVAFDEMFAEAGIEHGVDAEPPRLGRNVGMGRVVPPPARLAVTRAAASVAVIAVGVLIAVAVRSGQGSSEISSGVTSEAEGTPISTVDVSTPANAPDGANATSAPPGVSTNEATTPNAPRPATALVSVQEVVDDAGILAPFSVQTYDVATGQVVDEIQPWGEERAHWGTPQIAADGRAYFRRQPLPPWPCKENQQLMSIPWPNPSGQAGDTLQPEPVTDFGGWAWGLSPDGTTLFYDLVPDCSEATDGMDESAAGTYHPAIRVTDLATGDEMTITTRVERAERTPGQLRENSGIVSAVMTPDGDLVVVIGPNGDVYRLTPADGAVVEDDGVLVANVAQWGDANEGLPFLLGADDSSITVLSSGAGRFDFTVRRGPNADGTWAELVTLTGGGSAADDGYGNLVVVALPDAEVTVAPGESIPVLRTTTPARAFVSW